MFTLRDFGLMPLGKIINRLGGGGGGDVHLTSSSRFNDASKCESSQNPKSGENTKQTRQESFLQPLVTQANALKWAVMSERCYDVGGSWHSTLVTRISAPLPPSRFACRCVVSCSRTPHC